MLTIKPKKLTAKKTKQTGFTVVELLIATVVFSMVLVVFLSALVQISQLFYKGVNLSNTQETARNVTQNVSDDIRFSGSFMGDPSKSYFCVGNHRYTYKLGVQYQPSGNNYGILKENVGCSDPTQAATAPCASTASSCASPTQKPGQELLDPGMQVNKLDVNCPSNLCNISIHLVYYSNDPSVLTPGYQAPDALCTGPSASTQFCATADYNTSVLQNY